MNEYTISLLVNGEWVPEMETEEKAVVVNAESRRKAVAAFGVEKYKRGTWKVSKV